LFQPCETPHGSMPLLIQPLGHPWRSKGNATSCFKVRQQALLTRF
jgi:hypothetical protein